MAESEEAVKRGLTLRVLIAGLLLAAAVSLYWNIMLQEPQWLGTGNSDFGMKIMANMVDTLAGNDRFIVRSSQGWPLTMGLFIIINLLAAYMIKLRGAKGASPEILILLTMVSASLIYNIGDGNGLNFNYNTSGNQIGMAMYEFGGTAAQWAIVPPLMTCTDVAAYRAIAQVSTWVIPTAFYPAMVWNVLLYGSMTLFFVFLSMILKVLWFDVEAIPPLWAEVQTQSLVLVNETVQGSSSEAPGDRKKWFLIGFLVQALVTVMFYSYGVIDDIRNGPQNTFDWNFSGKLFGTAFETPLIRDAAVWGILPWVGIYFSFQPYQLAFSYMMPLDILYSALLGWAVFKLAIPVSFTSMGLLPPFTGDRTRNIHARIMYDQFVGADWTAGLNSGISLGLLVALAVYPMIRYRARILPMLQSLTGKGDKSLEGLSPLPLKMVWIGVIGCAIVYLGCWAAAGANMTVIIITMLFNALMVIGATRAGLYTAGVNFFNEFTSGGDNYRPPFYMPGMLAVNTLAAGPTATAGNAATYYAAVRVQGFMGQMNLQSQVLAHSLYSYKISDVFKISQRNTGMALILASGIAVVAGVVGYILRYAVWPWVPGSALGNASSISYQTEVATLLTQFKAGRWYDSTRRPVDTLLRLGNAGLAQYVGYCAIGFVIVPLMLMVRKMVPQFRMLPEGLALGAFLGGESYIIPAFFVGMVLRVITYKTGQVKAYNEKIQPACMGLIVGFFVPIAVFYLIQMLYNIPANMLWKLSRG